MLKDDSFRSGTSDAPTCECGAGKEKYAEHYLFHCIRYSKRREEMINQLLQIRKKDKTIDISETLLLAPQFDNISKSQRRIIKEVLFEFILAISRSL